MEKKEVKWSKLFALGLGGVVGLSYLGMIGTLINRESKLPSINVPVGPYTSYEAEVGKEGYRISYRANDPKVLHVERDINTKAGFLGLGNNKTRVSEQYTMDGSVHTKSNTTITDGRSEACVKAIGGAEQTGRLVGSSIGTAAAPAVTNIPFVGWVAAGWITMSSGNQGAETGGSMAESMSKDC